VKRLDESFNIKEFKKNLFGCTDEIDLTDLEISPSGNIRSLPLEERVKIRCSGLPCAS
jgi:hypothetical protein